MTTDLRAALRDTATAWDALGMRAAQPECDSHPLVNPDHCAARARHLRALADAPPTVAELIGQAVNGKAVEWVHIDPATAETTAMRAEWEGGDDGMHLCVSFYADDGTYCEGDADLMPSDLTQPATLVEVTP